MIGCKRFKYILNSKETPYTIPFNVILTYFIVEITFRETTTEKTSE